jgi:HD domain
MESVEQVEEARRLAQNMLSEAVPRRWFHTIGVARTAERLARALVPDWADEIVAAAWLHDIGYAPELRDTGFHPIDGAAYLLRDQPRLWQCVAPLVAHHSGAVFEARERGLQAEMSRYRPPVDLAMLAIVNCADLCTASNGTPVDPADRITELLTRYPADHPVHRAITKSAALLSAQACLVLGAATAARHAEPKVPLPDGVECVEQGLLLQTVWSGVHHRVTIRQAGRAVEITLTNPPQMWHPDDAGFFAGDLRAAADAAAGETLGWTQYRAFEPAASPGNERRDTGECILALGSTTTFYFDDVVALHLDMATQGRSVHVQQRTFNTLGDVTEWIDIAQLIIDGAPDLRGLKFIPAPNIVSQSTSDA